MEEQKFKAAIEKMMWQRYGLIWADFGSSYSQEDCKHFTPEEWCDWYAEKYNLKTTISYENAARLLSTFKKKSK